MFEQFEMTEIQTEKASIFVRWRGNGPAILLLHGFPQTHLMWHGVAPLLSDQFTVVCADLRGYGRSSCPASSDDHAPYSKRAMAHDMLAVMAQLGFSSFSVAGHDRGGRVAYRLALDHPKQVERLAVLDVVPTGEVWQRADARFAIAYWPWSLLAQPEPLPERLVAAAPDAIINNALANWGSAAAVFRPEVREAYIQALSYPEHIHAICEEYRAAATLDRQHDQADRQAGRRIECPLLVLWSNQGPLSSWYADVGGPIGLWQNWATEVRGQAFRVGHFFAEEMPEETATALSNFFMPAT